MSIEIGETCGQNHSLGLETGENKKIKQEMTLLGVRSPQNLMFS